MRLKPTNMRLESCADPPIFYKEGRIVINMLYMYQEDNPLRSPKERGFEIESDESITPDLNLRDFEIIYNLAFLV